MDNAKLKERQTQGFLQMWGFLLKGGQKANIPALKGYVNDLITMTTQKNGGQSGYGKKDDICVAQEFDMTMMSIVIEATALVLSGELDKLECENG